jgi:hypothetical protein
MHDILPEGEDLRRAVKWVSGNLQEVPGKPIRQLVQEATLKFVMDFFRQRKEEK